MYGIPKRHYTKMEKLMQPLLYLRENGHIYEQDGATWFRSTELGDDKDRVLIKQDGSYTYLTPDIAYHRNKLERGFEKLINIWGADHHGYIPRMKAAIEALGYNRDQLEVEIIQLVHLYKDGEKMKMSKRTGKAVTMRDLVDEVGLDATRYFFAMRSADTHMDFDLDLPFHNPMKIQCIIHNMHMLVFLAFYVQVQNKE